MIAHDGPGELRPLAVPRNALLHPHSHRRLSRRHLLVSVAALGAMGTARHVWAGEEDPLPATQRLNGWLESRFQFWLGRSPMEQAYLGLKTNADKWDTISEAHQ